MQFLTGSNLNRGVEEILREPDALLAVAFLGAGAEAHLQAQEGHKRRVVCNLTMGGTNPATVAALQDQVSMRHSETLHAKVYIGKEWTIVTSANLSANGLGLEITSESGWQEAGVRMETSDAIRSWFEGVWSSSSKVRKQDLDRAKAIWQNRRKTRPRAKSLAQYVIGDDFPLLGLSGNRKWTVQEENVGHQVGTYNDDVYYWISNSLELESDEDFDAAKHRWIIWATVNKNGTIGKSPFYWMLTGDRVIRNAFQYTDTGYTYDCLLAEETDKNGPFPISDNAFRSAFLTVINRPEYERLRIDDRTSGDEGTWYNEERLRLMKQLWIDVKEQFRAH